MKLTLPNGKKIELDNALPFEQKKFIVEEILNEWNDYFTRYKNKKTHTCLEILSSYLCHESKEVGDMIGKEEV